MKTPRPARKMVRRADQVAEPPREQQQPAEGDQVGVDDPGEVRGREAEVVLDRRQRDVDDRRRRARSSASPRRGRRARSSASGRLRLARLAFPPACVHVRLRLLSVRFPVQTGRQSRNSSAPAQTPGPAGLAGRPTPGAVRQAEAPEEVDEALGDRSAPPASACRHPGRRTPSTATMNAVTSLIRPSRMVSTLSANGKVRLSPLVPAVEGERGLAVGVDQDVAPAPVAGQRPDAQEADQRLGAPVPARRAAASTKQASSVSIATTASMSPRSHASM